MPLYELYRMDQARLDSSQDLNPPCSSWQLSLPENDLFELVWENGQISMQGHSNTPKRVSESKSSPSHCFPSYSPRSTDRHIGGNSSNQRTAKSGELDSVIDEIPMAVPSTEMGLHQDEYMVPWLSYAMNDSLHHGYSSELLPELSTVTANELPNTDNFSETGKRSSHNQAFRNSQKNSGHVGHTSEQGNVSRVSCIPESGAPILDTSSSQLYRKSPLQCLTSTSPLRPRQPEIQKASDGDNHLASDNMTQTRVRSTRGFSDTKLQNQGSEVPSHTSTMMNFSHFARPVALLRTNLHSVGATCGLPSARIGSAVSQDEDFAARSSHTHKSTPTDSNNGNAEKSTAQTKEVMPPSRVGLPPIESKPHHERAQANRHSEPVRETDVAKDGETCNKVPVENTPKGLTDGEKSGEPAVASSVCSGNSVEKTSDDPIQHKNRKSRDSDESEFHSEDVEEESVHVKKPAAARGGAGSKRSRAAEVHNLSERRRRDRINEKMRALQELIPNCNKVDKASMLDEAIEYLKTLQLQVQMMSMGAGLYMPQMMLPTALQHMHAPMPSFSPMGFGMHMGFGMGYGMGVPDISVSSSAYPMMQMPTVQGTHFTAPPRPVQTGLHGAAGSNLHVFGHPSQGFPISMSHAPLVSGAPLDKPTGPNATGGCVGNMDSASSVSGTKDSTEHMTSRVTLSAAAYEELNQIPNKATPPAGYNHSQTRDVNDSRIWNSGKEDQAEPCKPSCLSTS